MKREFAAAAFQIVERSNVGIGPVTFEHEREARSDEPCSTCNQYLHDVEMISDPDGIDYSWLTP